MFNIQEPFTIFTLANAIPNSITSSCIQRLAMDIDGWFAVKHAIMTH